MSVRGSTSDLPTMGVEEEFLLVDPDSGAPAPRNREVATEAARRGVDLQLGLSSCQVEITSGVAQDSRRLAEDLAALRSSAARAAEAVGVPGRRGFRRPPRTISRSPKPLAIGRSATSSGWSRTSRAHKRVNQYQVEGTP